MNVKYFTDTDTLFIQLNDRMVAETRELNEDLLIDVDCDQKVVGLTVEHVIEQPGRFDFYYGTSAA